MGEVFRAFDRLSGEVVALKRVLTYAEGEGISRSFSMESSSIGEQGVKLALAREFRLLATLHHPHIVRVLDFGFDGPYPYFTMQYLEEAETILQRGRGVDLSSQVDYLLQVLQALSYVHRRGILHRDLKPANILVQGQQAYLLDFGLSVEASQVGSLTAGTISYMAPELLMQQAASIASDLYALGVLAYQLFSGRYPFPHDDLATLYKAIRLAEVDYEPVPAHLRRVVQTLMAPLPKDRYPQAEAALQALCLASGRPLPAETPAIRESFLTAADFVGRSSQFQDLKAALAATGASGRGAFYLVGGESGVGKSRLLDEVRIHALIDGFVVLYGQDIQQGAGLYQLWRGPLRQLLLSLPEDAQLAEGDIQILAQLLPDIRALLGVEAASAPPLTQAAYADYLRLAVANLFQAQTRPILFLMEDLQWSKDSLELLRDLLPFFLERPMLLLGSYRLEERPELRDEFPQAQHLHLGRLGRGEIAQLARSMLGTEDENLVNFLEQETEGNMFFLVEAVRALAEDAGRLSQIAQMALPAEVNSSAMAALIDQRLRRVPAWARDLLSMAAVFGRYLDLRLLGATPLALDIKLNQWLQVCANAAVLEAVEGRWRFVHDKLRDGLLLGLSPKALRWCHESAARTIERLYPDEAGRAFALAFHWGQAGQSREELKYLLLALPQALAADNDVEVIAMGERILALLPPSDERRARLWRQVGEAYAHRSHYQAAQAAYEQSAALAEAAEDEAGLAEIFGRLASISWERGDFGQAQHYAGQGLGIARRLQQDAVVMANLTQLGAAAWDQGEFAAAEGHYEECLTLAREAQDLRAMAVTLNNLGMVAFDYADYHTARVYWQESLELKRKLGEQRRLAITLSNLGAVAGRLADYHTAQQLLEQSIAIERKIGHLAGLAKSLEHLGELVQRQGDSHRAKAHFIQAVELSRRIRGQTGVVDALIALGFNHLALGDVLKARPDLAEALHLAKRLNAWPRLLAVLIGLAWLRGLEGQPEAGAALLVAVAHHPVLLPDVAQWRIPPAQAFLRGHLSAEQWAQRVQAPLLDWESGLGAILSEFPNARPSGLT
jgi:tetratricopeptide (TPR) repeat protein